MRSPGRLLFCGMAVVSLFCFGAPAGSLQPATTGPSILSEALTFHASFDQSPDADFALGDRRIFTATSSQRSP